MRVNAMAIALLVGAGMTALAAWWVVKTVLTSIVAFMVVAQ